MAMAGMGWAGIAPCGEKGLSTLRVLLQRVANAAVRVDGAIVGGIGPGLLLLVGVAKGDDESDALWLARKVSHLRAFDDAAGKMNRSLLDSGGGALVVSQFTLYGDSRKGNRPSFTEAAHPERAEPIIRRFAELLRAEGVRRVESGVFGASMQIEMAGEGPVTILLESPGRARR